MGNLLIRHSIIFTEIYGHYNILIECLMVSEIFEFLLHCYRTLLLENLAVVDPC